MFSQLMIYQFKVANGLRKPLQGRPCGVSSASAHVANAPIPELVGSVVGLSRSSTQCPGRCKIPCSEWSSLTNPPLNPQAQICEMGPFASQCRHCQRDCVVQ